MKKYITTALILLAIATSHSQNTRTDTVMLSVYNTGSKFRLYPANFGSTTVPTGVIETLIAVSDSFVNTPIPAGTRMADSTIVRKLKELQNNRSVFTGTPIQSGRRTCTMTFPKDVKGKMVIIETDNACDDSDKCYSAQKAGAKGIIVIYPTENTNSVRMSGGRYNRDITIPCYSMTLKAGDTLRAQLPSKVGIFKINTPPRPNQSVVANDSSLVAKSEKTKDNSTSNDATLDADRLNSGNSISKQGFTVSPNPTHNQVNIAYQFPQPTDATITVRATSGQVLYNQLLRGVTVGDIDIQTSDWASGTYFVTLQYDKEMQTKKLVVRQ